MKSLFEKCRFLWLYFIDNSIEKISKDELSMLIAQNFGSTTKITIPTYLYQLVYFGFLTKEKDNYIVNKDWKRKNILESNDEFK